MLVAPEVSTTRIVDQSVQTALASCTPIHHARQADVGKDQRHFTTGPLLLTSREGKRPHTPASDHEGGTMDQNFRGWVLIVNPRPALTV